MENAKIKMRHFLVIFVHCAEKMFFDDFFFYIFLVVKMTTFLVMTMMTVLELQMMILGERTMNKTLLVSMTKSLKNPSKL